jgi:hypothetical protein
VTVGKLLRYSLVLGLPRGAYLGESRNTLDQSVHLNADEADELARQVCIGRMNAVLTLTWMRDCTSAQSGWCDNRCGRRGTDLHNPTSELLVRHCWFARHQLPW